MDVEVSRATISIGFDNELEFFQFSKKKEKKKEIELDIMNRDSLVLREMKKIT